jgi:hypothetical protein
VSQKSSAARRRSPFRAPRRAAGCQHPDERERTSGHPDDTAALDRAAACRTMTPRKSASSGRARSPRDSAEPDMTSAVESWRSPRRDQGAADERPRGATHHGFIRCRHGDSPAGGGEAYGAPGLRFVPLASDQPATTTAVVTRQRTRHMPALAFLRSVSRSCTPHVTRGQRSASFRLTPCASAQPKVVERDAAEARPPVGGSGRRVRWTGERSPPRCGTRTSGGGALPLPTPHSRSRPVARRSTARSALHTCTRN